MVSVTHNSRDQVEFAGGRITPHCTSACSSTAQHHTSPTMLCVCNTRLLFSRLCYWVHSCSIVPITRRAVQDQLSLVGHRYQILPMQHHGKTLHVSHDIGQVRYAQGRLLCFSQPRHHTVSLAAVVQRVNGCSSTASQWLQ